LQLINREILLLFKGFFDEQQVCEMCLLINGFDVLGDVNAVLFKADLIQLKSEVKRELASLKKLQKVLTIYVNLNNFTV